MDSEEEEVASAMREAGSLLTRLAGWLVATILGGLGVLSGCGGSSPATPEYGVPGVVVGGTTYSAADSARAIPGILVRLTTADSTTVYSSDTTDAGGGFSVGISDDLYPYPGAIRIVATDIDGSQQGTFMEADTIFAIDTEGGGYHVDVFLMEAGD